MVAEANGYREVATWLDESEPELLQTLEAAVAECSVDSDGDGGGGGGGGGDVGRGSDSGGGGGDGGGGDGGGGGGGRVSGTQTTQNGNCINGNSNNASNSISGSSSWCCSSKSNDDGRGGMNKVVEDVEGEEGCGSHQAADGRRNAAEDTGIRAGQEEAVSRRSIAGTAHHENDEDGDCGIALVVRGPTSTIFRNEAVHAPRAQPTVESKNGAASRDISRASSPTASPCRSDGTFEQRDGGEGQGHGPIADDAEGTGNTCFESSIDAVGSSSGDQWRCGVGVDDQAALEVEKSTDKRCRSSALREVGMACWAAGHPPCEASLARLNERLDVAANVTGASPTRLGCGSCVGEEGENRRGRETSATVLGGADIPGGRDNEEGCFSKKDGWWPGFGRLVACLTTRVVASLSRTLEDGKP